MLYNYLKTTFRNLLRYKLFSTINIFGLSISLACCLLLFLYAQKELGYDKSYDKEIYRVISSVKQKEGDLMTIGSSSVPVAPRIVQDIPEIRRTARLTGAAFFQSKDMITVKDNSYYIENGYVADTALFSIFNYKIIAGNKSQPLANNNAIVLEKEWAEKLFESANESIGKTVKLSTLLGVFDYEITAVYDKEAFLTHLTPSFIISTNNAPWSQFFNRFSSQWIGNNLVFTYIELAEGADPILVESKIQQILLDNGLEEMEAIGVSKSMSLQPVAEIHTSTEGFDMDMPNKTDLTFINILITIGGLVLILACFNYINLSTAQAGKRSLEVGVRKAMGVTTGGLRKQFLGESFVIVLISTVFSLLIAELALPFFNNLISTPISLGLENLSTIALFSVVFLFLTAFLAGFYPAIYLSKFNPAEVLKGGSSGSSKSGNLRKILVIFQFTISILLISAIITISNQVEYIKDKELGFNSESKLVIPLSTEEAARSYKLLKDKFSAHASVRGVSGSSSIPGTPIINDWLMYKEGQTMEDAIHIFNNSIDINYLQLMEIDLIGGTYFKRYKTDTTYTADVIINQIAAEQLDIDPEESQNEMLYFDWQGVNYKFRLLGVVENTNQFSLHQEIEPLVFQLGSNERADYMTVDADLSNFQSVVSTLESDWKSLIDSTPFEFYTLDDHLNLQYAKDYNTFNLIKSFALISLIISCLGLYALSMFVAERRFKEIGIRKALGATVKDVIILVSKDLSLLIIISFIVSIPISIYAMNKWLEGFAYRISLGFEIFILAGILSVVIGWMTISYQSFRAARTNPVNVLRDE